MKMKAKKRIKYNWLVFIVVMLVCILTTFIFAVFNKKINPKLIEISRQNLNKITYSLIMDYLDDEILNQEYLDNILIITKNKNQEILAVDFNLENAYVVLSEITRRIEENINELEKGHIKIDYYDGYLTAGANALVLSVPMGAVSDYVYLNNIGPKIPVKIDFIGTVVTNLKTKITNYGLNNVLVELYAYIWLTEEITTPVTFKTEKIEYDVLIAAKMINGRVPSFYGEALEGETNLFNIPLE